LADVPVTANSLHANIGNTKVFRMKRSLVIDLSRFTGRLSAPRETQDTRLIAGISNSSALQENRKSETVKLGGIK
jgi:hypothetical protein